jgi:hypothetical protein
VRALLGFWVGRGFCRILVVGRDGEERRDGGEGNER